MDILAQDGRTYVGNGSRDGARHSREIVVMTMEYVKGVFLAGGQGFGEGTRLGRDVPACSSRWRKQRWIQRKRDGRDSQFKALKDANESSETRLPPRDL